ncbi:MAG: zf-HC2 domain-containing protein, partial [Verrucomicrobiota bacterium]|nr:zf-HC2 domain-containing protein [Verrucomicrobiota bacterium]
LRSRKLPMNCQEIQTMLHAYGDGELDAMSSLEVEKHIQACPKCRQTYRNLSVLKEAVTASAPYFKAPAHLRRSIIAATSKQVASEEPSLRLHGPGAGATSPPDSRWPLA